jgi:transcriptional regulatory protein RtcR
MKRKVILGFLGTKLDAGKSEKRWDRWRPTVALFAHEHFKAARLELLLNKSEDAELAQRVADDIGTLDPSVEVNAHVLDLADPWDFASVYGALHDFAKGYKFSEDCDYYVHLTTGTHVAQICLFLLLEARYFPAQILETLSNGTDPGDEWRGRIEVIDLKVAAYDQLAQRFKKERLDSQGLLKGGIETRNAAFNSLISRIERVALASNAPILLSGPTGAGKSQLAKQIYELRKSRHLVGGPLVEVNCATLRGDNAMSTLFGHKKGAFTGATTDRAGLLKMADKGLLFLDEVAELGVDEQAMLLRALEDKRFRPLGADSEIASDFQLLAGTNQNLQQLSEKGLFRADLLARINLWDFTLPGLKDRREDIAPNVEFETTRVGREIGKNVTWSTQAMESFMSFALSHSWPGNFRDLGACITRLGTLAQDARITQDDVSVEIACMSKSQVRSNEKESEKYPLARKILGNDRVENIDLFEIAQIETVLLAMKTTSNMAEASRTLFACSRLNKSSTNDSSRLRKVLLSWGISYTEVKSQLSALTY